MKKIEKKSDPTKDTEVGEYIKVGDMFEVEEEHLRHLRSLQERTNSAQMLIQVAGDNLKHAQKVLWEFVSEIHPELEEFHLSIDNSDDTPVILIIGRK